MDGGGVPLTAHFFDMDSRFTLTFDGGDRDGESLALEGSSLTIGRLEKCDVTIDDHTVSSEHAALSLDGSVWTLTDLGSTNGTFVDEARVEAEPRTLGDGCSVRVGETRLLFTDADAMGSMAIDALPERRTPWGLFALILVLAGGGTAAWMLREPGSAALALAEAAPGNLLAQDWSFEGDGGWEMDGGARLVGTGQVSGMRALLLDGPGAQSRWARTHELERGRRVRVTGRQAGPVPPRVDLEFEVGHADGTGQVQPYVYPLETTVGADGSFEGQVVPPPGARRVGLVLRGPAEGPVTVDDLGLEFAGAAQIVRPSIGAYELVRPDGLPAAIGVWKHDRYVLLGLANAGSAQVADDGRAFSVGVSGGTRLEVSPDLMSQAGFLLLAGGQALRSDEELAAEDVDSLILGADNDRIRLRFDPPASVDARRHAAGARVELGWPGPATVAVQVDFTVEKTRASQLESEARDSESAGRPGAAMAVYSTILDEFPFDPAAVERATERHTALLQTGLKRLSVLRGQSEEAAFFGLVDGYQALEAGLGRLVDDFAGTEVAAEAGRLKERAADQRGLLEVARGTDQAARLLQRATELGASGSGVLADHMLHYLIDAHPGTTAAATALERLGTGGGR